MAAGRLLIFNPETDFALASGLKQYTPPANVRRMRRRLSLLPALYGSEGDDILVDADMSLQEIQSLPFFDIACSKNMGVVSRPQRDYVLADPWGWNYSIRGRLRQLGFDGSLLPSDRCLQSIRHLSHRRLSIAFNKEINLLTGLDTPIPVEMDCADEAIRFTAMNPGAFIKLPWSSSGRGTLRAGRQSAEKERQWIAGAIRRQGSVLAESPCSRAIDFATEWEIRSGKAVFLGLSLFSTDDSGGYLGNIIRPQQALAQSIGAAIPLPLTALIEAQRSALNRLVAPGYDGLLGIDCCSDGHDDLRGCLEINLRRTMGHVALGIDPDMCGFFSPVKTHLPCLS